MQGNDEKVLENVKGIIEALLFTSAETLPLNRLARYLSISRKEALSYIQELSREYEERRSAIRIKKIGDGVRLETRPEMAPHIQEFHHPPKEQSLSPASLETLAIIAYRQPVTRGEIEAIRGVKAEKPIATLRSHNLIQEVGRREGPGKPILYGTGQTFLELFGLEGLDALPPLEELKAENNDGEMKEEREEGRQDREEP